jgi:hypothetical protein
MKTYHINDELTREQVQFLKKLNYILANKERELFERLRTISEIYEKRLKRNGGDLEDYNLDLYIEYYTGRSSPAFVYNEAFSLRHIEFKQKQLNDDWSEVQFPKLGTRWCYTMHAFWDHNRTNKHIFKITDIWFAVRIEEQQHIKIGKHEMIV